MLSEREGKWKGGGVRGDGYLELPTFRVKMVKLSHVYSSTLLRTTSFSPLVLTYFPSSAKHWQVQVL